MSECITTSMIVLRKTPYRETSLVVSGVSPDCGQLDIMARGARKLSPKQFPVFDLFREVQVEFRDSSHSNMYNPLNAELLTAFDAVALTPEYFELAVKIGSFILKNSAPRLPAPLIYDALRNVLINFSMPAAKQPPLWTPAQCSVIIKTTCLYEHGLLPENLGGEPEKEARLNQLMENIIAAGNEAASLPECADGYYPRLNKWLNKLIKYHNLPV